MPLVKNNPYHFKRHLSNSTLISPFPTKKDSSSSLLHISHCLTLLFPRHLLHFQQNDSSFPTVIFSSRGVRSTLVTTPANAATVLASSPNLSIVTVPFPSPDETHLPPGKENLSSVPSSLLNTFTGSLRLFRPLLEPIIADQNPDCIISDSLFPWTADFDIPA